MKKVWEGILQICFLLYSVYFDSKRVEGWNRKWNRGFVYNIGVYFGRSKGCYECTMWRKDRQWKKSDLFMLPFLFRSSIEIVKKEVKTISFFIVTYFKGYYQCTIWRKGRKWKKGDLSLCCHLYFEDQFAIVKGSKNIPSLSMLWHILTLNELKYEEERWQKKKKQGNRFHLAVWKYTNRKRKK